MQKNIYIKSMLRQPIRSMLLVLLIATASFAFVVRAVEYIVVRDRITEMSNFFHNVGVLTHRGGITADVSQVMDFISNNPYVAHYDKRRGFEGNLVGMYNAHIDGSHYWQSSWLYEHFPYDHFSREYVELMPQLRAIDGFAGFVSGDSFFYGELIDIVHVYDAPGVHWLGFAPHKILYVRVDEVLQGYPERLFEGQLLRLRMDFPEVWNVFTEMNDADHELHISPFEKIDSPLADMEIGQRYLLRGTYYFMLGRLQLDSRHIMKYIRPLGEEGLWYVAVAPGETMDTTALGMCRQLEFVRHAQSSVYLRTTRDMRLMPTAQEGRDLLSPWAGRFIDMDDYLNARPVVVINRRFAQRRSLEIGDTITVAVSPDQHLVLSPYYMIGNVGETAPISERITALPLLGVLSRPGSDPALTLELEIIGIYDTFRMRMISTDWSSMSKLMYIPDSLLPADWGLQSAYFGHIPPEYTPALWYSFSLHDQRNQSAFLWNTRDQLAAMGFRASFVGRDGSGFWATADLIMMSITLNLLMFSMVLTLTLALTVALFTWQRKKDFAILRSLGCPFKSIFVQSSSALAFFGIPAVLIGSIAGWFYSLGLTEDTIEGFGEIITDAIGFGLLPSEREALIASYMEAALPSISWLIVLIIIILVVMLALISISNIRASRLSVLEILQEARK